MRRAGALFAAILLFGGCSGGRTQHRAHLSALQDLSEIQATRTALRNGASGAPISGVVVSGTITNTGSMPLRCRATAFLLLDSSGNALMPRTQFCDVPSIGPHRSAGFSATFTTTDPAQLQLRFEHPDGTYETHELIVPPV